MAGKTEGVDEKKEDSLDTPEAVNEIRKLIESGSLDAISVDTSIFDENKQRLDKGLFSQLQQFGRHPASFVMPDVVYREIKRHLADHISKSQTRYSRDLTDLCEFVGGDVGEVETLKKKLQEMPSAEDLCEEQLKQFMSASSADLLKAEDHVKMGELIEIYFNKQPPFQASNLKKSEFPDAIALKTLENWAAKTKREILVVSKDGDWKSFCDQSKHLYLLKDLARALELFQSPDDLVKSILDRIVTDLQYSGSILCNHLEDELSRYSWNWEVNVDATSQFDVHQRNVEFVSVLDFNYYGGSAGVKLTDINDDKMSVSFSFQAIIELTVEMSFQKWDGIDKEYISMGTTTIPTVVEVNVDASITLPIKNGELREFKVEIQPGYVHVDLEEIEPDWMNERE